jgi:ribosomal-protein-alanine N-acetyltransferase
VIGHGRAIGVDDRFIGELVSLRLVTLADCTERYEAWLADPRVNAYLETRWSVQDLSSIRDFVTAMLASPINYLFAIVRNDDARHIGNIKVGPLNTHHAYADVSYFIGEPSSWGKGYATEAIQLATAFAFVRLELHRLQAGLYASNGGSGRALEKAGYAQEGVFRQQLLNASGEREDHHWFGLLRSEWKPTSGHLKAVAS